MLIELRKPQNNYSPQNNSETIKMNMMKKDLKKNISLQKKDRKLQMIKDLYHSIIMEYQKLMNLLDNTPNQSSKFKTRNWSK